MNDILTVELTPIKYLENDNQTKRNHLQYCSRKSSVQLEIVHDESNQYDDKALQVLYDGVHIGYIRKRYIDEDLTHMINAFCFEYNSLKDIGMQCVDSIYTISVMMGDVMNLNVSPHIDKSDLDKRLDALVQNSGWIRK